MRPQFIGHGGVRVAHSLVLGDGNKMASDSKLMQQEKDPSQSLQAAELLPSPKNI